MRVPERFGKPKGRYHDPVRLALPAKPTTGTRARPKGSYVYFIRVNGVVRYVGKGIEDRMFAHMKEVRQRLTREYKLRNVGPLFQRKLTEAVVNGAVIEEVIVADDLTSKEAYELEYRYLEQMVHEGKRRQLWNVIPGSIYTPQEYNDYVQRLNKTLSSRSRLGRLLARSQLVRLGILPAQQ
jgi:hypothetical protein